MFFLALFRPVRQCGNNCKTIVIKKTAERPILQRFCSKAFEKTKKLSVDLWGAVPLSW